MVIGEPEWPHCYVDVIKSDGRGNVQTRKIDEPIYPVSYQHREKNISSGLTVAIPVSKYAEKIPVLFAEFKALVETRRTERLERVVEKRKELAIGRTYPRLTHFEFKNVTVHIIEDFRGKMWDVKEPYLGKSYQLFFNKRRLYPHINEPVEHELSADFILGALHPGRLEDYGHVYQDFLGERKPYSETTYKEAINLLPMYEFLGYEVKFRGEVLKILDLNFKFGVRDYLEYEVLGELDTWGMFTALQNKLKYLS